VTGNTAMRILSGSTTQRMPFSGMLPRAALIRNDDSEQCTANAVLQLLITANVIRNVGSLKGHTA
jgi:hypothetical protein